MIQKMPTNSATKTPLEIFAGGSIVPAFLSPVCAGLRLMMDFQQIA